MGKHIDFTKYTVTIDLDPDQVTLTVRKAHESEGCERCGEAPAEITIDASSMGQGGYDVGYCYPCAVVMMREAWRAGEAWELAE